MPTKNRREFSRTVKADFERLLRQSLNEASGFAECLGLENLAQYLHFVSLDDLTAPEYRSTEICTNHHGKAQKIIEEPREMRYNQNKSPKRAESVKIMKKIEIKANEAYICGGNGCEYRLHTDSGKPSIYVLRDWYEADGTDKDGNEYRIVWALRKGFDPATNPDESEACDWDSPAEVIRLDDGANVTDRAEII
jgi:hypothetical protein